VDHGDVATSAGAGAGIDLCLHLVRRDHGAAHAALLARHMVMPPHREGGQAQDAPPPPPGDALDGLPEWAGARLGTPLAVGDLAAHLSVSPRTLARRFADQLGTSPAAWLLSRRVAAARTLLEETDLPVEAIAARVGLTSAVNLRPLPRPGGHNPGRLPPRVQGQALEDQNPLARTVPCFDKTADQLGLTAAYAARPS
jgi:AraC family transcriptional activator FtrA